MTKEEYEKLGGMLENEWNGYTLDELKYKRALALARKEIQKEKTLNHAQQMIGAGFSLSNVGGSFAKRIIGTVTITDYIVIGFKLARKISKLYNHWRK